MTKIVCLGDSLTQGYDILSDRSWPSLLRTTLGVKVVNSGISGDTTAGMLSRMDRDVIAHNPTHLIIMGGTNDVSLRLSDELIISHLYAILRQAKYYNVDTIIGIPTPYFLATETVSNHLFISTTELKQRIDQLRKILKQLALADNRPYIDFGYGLTSAHYLMDGLHPNRVGHQIMANNAEAVIMSMNTIK